MRPMHPHHMHPVHSPYPDNWPWSEPVPPRPPHSCCPPPPPPPPWAPHPCPPPPFVPTPGGFCAQEPENGTPVSGLAKAIRHSKRAFLSLTSVPALFSVDVQDGDIVKPVPADDSFKDLLCAMGPAAKLPDAVWVPAFRTVDSQPDTQVDEEAPAEPAKPVLSDYDPSFYGVAYRGVSRVMIGPVVTHPRFMFHTGDKVYADANGDLTLTENENFVGVCLAPGALYLLPQTSAFSEFLEAYRQEIIETTTKEIIESIEGGELDGGSITVTVPGTTTDRPLSDRFQDTVNIKDFGAVGDGTTDNAMAFFLAIQRAQELGSNVCLFIPVGDYLTTQLPTVPCYGPGSIIFEGQTYAPFELLFTIKGGISKDSSGRYKVNPAEFPEDAIRDLINKILGTGGDGENPGGGGIGVDEDGNIIIDFGSLTEEQINELLEILNKYLPDLKEPIVDPNGGLVNTALGLAIKPTAHGGLYTTSLGASILLDDDSGLKLSTAGLAVFPKYQGTVLVTEEGVDIQDTAVGKRGVVTLLSTIEPNNVLAVPTSKAINDAITAVEDSLSVAVNSTIMPKGSIVAFSGTFGGKGNRHPIPLGGTTPNTSWVLCDGGSDGGTGKVPDLRGRMIIGTSNQYPKGSTGGSADSSTAVSVGPATISIAQLPSHQHGISIGNDNGAWPIPNGCNVGLGVAYEPCQFTGNSEAHTHSLVDIQRNGNLPPYYSLAYIIRIA